MSKRVALTAAPRELAALTGQAVPNYRKLWTMIVDGHLPAEQIAGRYFVDIPELAEALGLTPVHANAA